DPSSGKGSRCTPQRRGDQRRRSPGNRSIPTDPTNVSAIFKPVNSVVRFLGLLETLVRVSDINQRADPRPPAPHATAGGPLDRSATNPVRRRRRRGPRARRGPRRRWLAPAFRAKGGLVRHFLPRRERAATWQSG